MSLCPGYTANKHVVLNSTEYYVVNRVLPKNITEGQGGDLILLIAENINHLLPHKNWSSCLLQVSQLRAMFTHLLLELCFDEPLSWKYSSLWRGQSSDFTDTQMISSRFVKIYQYRQYIKSSFLASFECACWLWNSVCCWSFIVEWQIVDDGWVFIEHATQCCVRDDCW